MALCKTRRPARYFFVCIAISIGVVFTIFVITPIVFRIFPTLLKGYIFVPNDEPPANTNYKHPESAGFVGGRNFYLKTEDGATLGVWHTLPLNLADNAKTLNVTIREKDSEDDVYNEWLSDATVFLYLHGSAGSRTSEHRTRVYRLLNQLNYHVITFDYRGYGDSTSFPSGETDLVLDTKTVFAWIHKKVSSGNIFIWGHSLGTGISAHFIDDIVNNNRGHINGVILEAPFYNMAAAVEASPLSKAVSFLPWFKYCFIEPLAENDMAFDSAKHLRNVTTPVLILHAEDDRIIPYTQAEQLYEEVSESRKYLTVDIKVYNRTFHYGHYNIALNPHLPVIVQKFVELNRAGRSSKSKK